MALLPRADVEVSCRDSPTLAIIERTGWRTKGGLGGPLVLIGDDVQPYGGCHELVCNSAMNSFRPPMLAALRDHPFLSEVPVSSLRRLVNHAYRAEFAPGETVFCEGAPADRFFLIRKGLVKLDIEVAGRGRVDLETLGADTALGWSWLLAPYRWHLSATAVEQTSVVVLDASMLRALMAADSVLGYEMMRRFAAVMFDRLQATRASCAAEDVVTLPEAAIAGPWAGIKAMVPSLA